MAGNIPQQAPEPGAEGEGGEASKPESTGARGGSLAAYLPLIVAVIVMPLLAWVTLKFTSSGGARENGNADHGTEEQASHGAEETTSHGESGGASKPYTGELTVLVPITRNPLWFRPKEEGERKPEGPEKVTLVSFDRILVVDQKGESIGLATADTITVHIAGTAGQRFAVARLFLEGTDTNLIEAVNRNRHKLMDVATEVLSSKTLVEMNRPGFKEILRAELHQRFIHSIAPKYPGSFIKRVVITEFMIQ